MFFLWCGSGAGNTASTKSESFGSVHEFLCTKSVLKTSKNKRFYFINAAWVPQLGSAPL